MARFAVTPLLLLVVLLVAHGTIAAQELEPGSYQNAPTGVNVVAASVRVSRGNVLLEASLQVEGAHAEVELRWNVRKPTAAAGRLPATILLCTSFVLREQHLGVS